MYTFFKNQLLFKFFILPGRLLGLQLGNRVTSQNVPLGPAAKLYSTLYTWVWKQQIKIYNIMCVGHL